MVREKPSLLKLLLFIFAILISFFWFWLIIAKSINISVIDASLEDLKLLLLPIIPLVIGLTFLTILSILQDIPSWVKIIISVLIGLPAFFIAQPPSALAGLAAIFVTLGVFWTSEKLRLEAEDHLKVRIFHLTQAGGIPLLLTLIILSISLLAVSNINPKIKKNGLVIPQGLIQKDSPILQIIPGFNQLEQMTSKSTLNSDSEFSFNSEQQLELLAKNLTVEYQPPDTIYDLIRKNLEQKLNKIFKGSTTSILLLIGATIFISLIILRWPILVFLTFMISAIFWLFKSTKLIEIKATQVEAQLPFLGKSFDEE